MKILFVMIITVLLIGCSGGATESWLTPEQRLAVSDLLRENDKAELVDASECESPDLDRYRSEHANYHPYYAVSDFNGDGSEDFVIATKTAGAYDLWFFSGSGGSYRKPQNFGTVAWLNEGGFVIQGKYLFVGKFYSDDGTLYTWDAQAGRFGVSSDDAR